MDLKDGFYLGAFEADDKANLLRYLNDRSIYDNTLRIPFPYTEKDADSWLERAHSWHAKHGQAVHWAIRKHGEGLVGGIGFQDFDPAATHSAEIGYWLARPYWGRGIMTEAVRRVASYGFRELGRVRITACVFSWNLGSCRVLEKAEFTYEGLLRKAHYKDGRYIDARHYAILAEDLKEETA